MHPWEEVAGIDRADHLLVVGVFARCELFGLLLGGFTPG